MSVDETLRMEAVQTASQEEREQELREWTVQDAPPMDVMQAVALRKYLEGMRAYQESGMCSLDQRSRLKQERSDLYERGIIRDNKEPSVVEAVVERLNQLVEQYADMACANDATYGYGLLGRAVKGHNTSIADPLEMEARDLMSLTEKNYPCMAAKVNEAVREDRFGFLRKARLSYRK